MSAIGEIIAAGATKLYNVIFVGSAAIVARVLSAFGLTLVTVNGVLPALKDFVTPYVTALPPSVLGFLGAIGFDVAITMIISALTIAWGNKVFLVPTSVANALRNQP